MEELISQLNELCEKQPFQTGWYLKDLVTGDTADRNGDVVVPSASTRKIAILMASLKAVTEGKLALDQPVTIQAKYQENKGGCFPHLQPGFTVQFKDLLVMMIIVSDNTCTGTVADMVGLVYVNDLCRSIGMKGTTHRQGIPPADIWTGWDHYDWNFPAEASNTTTPSDVGLLLDLMLQGSEDADAAARLGCTPELCGWAIEVLSWQIYRECLPALLPAATKVANKDGVYPRNFNDVGIIFKDDQPLFILAVFTDYVPVELPDSTPGGAAAKRHIARLCRTCWDSLKIVRGAG